MNGKKQKIRLNKAIAQSGLVSRRNADVLIKAGQVKVNGKLVTQYSFYVLPSDDIKVNGRTINLCDFKYLLFYKPMGYITTKQDEKNRKTVYDLLPSQVSVLKYAGRLDRDSEGLLIFSNDGDFLNIAASPSSKIKKVYLVTLEKNITNVEFEAIKLKMLNGIYLDGMLCKATSVKYIKDKKLSVLEIVLEEGHNRQIRRMLQIIGFTASKLKRTQIGGFKLGNLRPGEHKEITKEEAYEKLRSKKGDSF